MAARAECEALRRAGVAVSSGAVTPPAPGVDMFALVAEDSTGAVVSGVGSAVFRARAVLSDAGPAVVGRSVDRPRGAAIDRVGDGLVSTPVRARRAAAGGREETICAARALRSALPGISVGLPAAGGAGAMMAAVAVISALSSR